MKDAVDRGVDVRIVYDARKESPRLKNCETVTAEGLDLACIERTRFASYISHNKFIVKLENGRPKSVWTGGTTFPRAGYSGIEDVAAKFLDYWAPSPKTLQ